MDATVYQSRALMTENTDVDGIFDRLKATMRLSEALDGLCGESGECIDILKKHVFQGHDLDKRHLASELGDVAWYLALAADAIGHPLNDIFEMNLSKLRARYGDGFDFNKSINRKDGDI